MAKSKSTTTAAAGAAPESSPAPLVPNAVIKKVELATRRIESVRSTVVCLQYARLHQDADIDRDVASCLQMNVADALTDLEAELAKVVMELARRPTTADPSKLL